MVGGRIVDRWLIVWMDRFRKVNGYVCMCLSLRLWSKYRLEQDVGI